MQKKHIFSILAGSMALVVLNALLISSSSSHAWSNKGTLCAEITNSLEYSLVPVEGGTFWMGSDDEGDEQPRHRVTVDNFFIGEFEVTQRLWEQVMGSNPSNFKGGNRPVEQVGWDDCQKFIWKLNCRRGEMNLGEYGNWHFRLPTEAEWEYAARGGNKSRGYKYAGSNDVNRVAWYDDNSGSQTHDVGRKSPNELGLYDMSGNVWEWCSDWYGSGRLLCGGSWRDLARYCRVSYRGDFNPDFSFNNYGFRLVLSP